MHPQGVMATTEGYRKGVRGHREQLITGMGGVVSGMFSCTLTGKEITQRPELSVSP